MRTQTRLDSATRTFLIQSQNIRPAKMKAPSALPTFTDQQLLAQLNTGKRAFSKLQAILDRRASFKQAH